MKINQFTAFDDRAGPGPISCKAGKYLDCATERPASTVIDNSLLVIVHQK